MSRWPTRRLTSKFFNNFAEQHLTQGFVAGGSKQAFHKSSEQIAQLLVAHKLILPEDHIFDLGCGNGRLPLAIYIAGLAERVKYTGVDIIPGSVEFCTKLGKHLNPSWYFHLWEVHNDHYYKHKQPVETARLPFNDATFDNAFAISVFTHQGSREATLALWAEFVRVVKPGGRLLVTWLTSPPYDLSDDQAASVFEAEWVDSLMHTTGKVVGKFTLAGHQAKDGWEHQWYSIVLPTQSQPQAHHQFVSG